MNRDQSPHRPPDLDRRIDRLVANELPHDDRRALLLELEAAPDGWRRCALAFLEDQAWRSALAELAPGSVVAPIDAPPPILVPQRDPARRAIRLALAAGLAALALGSSFWAGTALPARPGAVVALKPTAPPEPAVDAPSTHPPLTPDDEIPPGQPLGWVGLVQQDDGAAVVRPVPYLASTPANAAWVESQPPTIPDYVRAQIERQGYQVAESHRLVDVSLEDGRRVAIPVDEVAVDYVGRVPL